MEMDLVRKSDVTVSGACREPSRDLPGLCDTLGLWDCGCQRVLWMTALGRSLNSYFVFLKWIESHRITEEGQDLWFHLAQPLLRAGQGRIRCEWRLHGCSGCWSWGLPPSQIFLFYNTWFSWHSLNLLLPLMLSQCLWCTWCTQGIEETGPDSSLCCPGTGLEVSWSFHAWGHSKLNWPQPWATCYSWSPGVPSALAIPCEFVI